MFFVHGTGTYGKGDLIEIRHVFKIDCKDITANDLLLCTYMEDDFMYLFPLLLIVIEPNIR